MNKWLLLVTLQMGAAITSSQGLPDIVRLIPGHASSPQVTFSLDGNFAVTYDSTSTSKVWSAVDGRFLFSRQLNISVPPVGECLTQENALLLAEGTHLKVVALPTFIPIRDVPMGDAARSLTLSADGQRACCRLRNRVVVYDVGTLAPLASIATSIISTSMVGMNHDGSLIAVPDQDRVKVWGIDGQLKGTVMRQVTDCSMSPDGRYLVTQHFTKNGAEVWDWKAGLRVAMLPIPEGSSTGVAWSPRGDFIATTGRVVRLWSTKDWSLVHEIVPTDGSSAFPRFSDDGFRLFLGERNGAASKRKVPDLTLEQSFGQIQGKWTAIELSDDGQYMALYDPDGPRISVFDITTGESKSALVPGGGFAAPESSPFAWFPNEHKILFVSGNDSLFKVADIDSGSVENAHFLSSTSLLTRWGGGVMRRVPGTNQVLLVDDYRLALVDVKARLVKWSLIRGTNPCGLVCSPDGRYFSLVEQTGITICRTLDASVIKTIGQQQVAAAAKFTPAGSQFVVGRSDGSLEFYNSDNWSLERTFQTGQVITGLEFSPNGERLAVPSATEQFKIFDPRTGSLVAMYDQETAWLWAMRYSADGTKIIIPRTDGTVLFIASP